MNRKRSLVVVATALTLVTAACGSGGSDGGGEQTSAAPASPSELTVSPSDMTDQQQAPSRLVIDVTIKGGEVTPTNEQLQGKVGDPIVVRVNSDAADELHVQFQFTVDVPGTVDIELHQLNRVIASVQVQQ
jgi:ABC-type glycerol-3-phosphate transport system substrate-binding protein